MTILVAVSDGRASHLATDLAATSPDAQIRSPVPTKAVLRTDFVIGVTGAPVVIDILSRGLPDLPVEPDTVRWARNSLMPHVTDALEGADVDWCGVLMTRNSVLGINADGAILAPYRMRRFRVVVEGSGAGMALGYIAAAIRYGEKDARRLALEAARTVVKHVPMCGYGVSVTSLE